jgi:prevent-host-death family protein
MNVVNIHEAKTNLSKLVEQAAQGEPFIIAKAGKPMVKVVALDAPTGKKMKRRGFWRGRLKSPTTSTPCSSRRSKRCSTGRNEAAVRYSSPSMDGRKFAPSA